MSLDSSRPGLVDQLETALPRIELRCQTCWMPDSFVPEIRQPPDFLAIVHGGALAYLSPRASFVRALERDRVRELLAHTRSAVHGEVAGGGGVDTAVGRPSTDLRLFVEFPPSPAEHLRFSFLHLHSERAFTCEPLRVLLTALRTELSNDPRVDLSPWDLLITRFQQPPTEPLWSAGEVVPLDPASRCDIPIREEFYLRLGQPPGPSTLYHVKPVSGGLLIEQRDSSRAPAQHQWKVPYYTWWYSASPGVLHREMPTDDEVRLGVGFSEAIELETAPTGRRAYIQKPR